MYVCVCYFCSTGIQGIEKKKCVLIEKYDENEDLEK